MFESYRCSKKSIGRFCSCGLASKLFDIYSKDECITLTFRTDQTNSGTGFVAHYSSFDKHESFSNAKLCRYVYNHDANTRIIII